MTLRGNYLDLSSEDLQRISPEDVEMIVSKVAQMVLAEFKGLDCSVCTKHFGYEYRGNPSIILCSSTCLALAQKKLKASGSTEPLESHSKYERSSTGGSGESKIELREKLSAGPSALTETFLKALAKKVIHEPKSKNALPAAVNEPENKIMGEDGAHVDDRVNKTDIPGDVIIPEGPSVRENGHGFSTHPRAQSVRGRALGGVVKVAGPTIVKPPTLKTSSAYERKEPAVAATGSGNAVASRKEDQTEVKDESLKTVIFPVGKEPDIGEVDVVIDEVDNRIEPKKVVTAVELKQELSLSPSTLSSIPVKPSTTSCATAKLSVSSIPVKSLGASSLTQKLSDTSSLSKKPSDTSSGTVKPTDMTSVPGKPSPLPSGPLEPLEISSVPGKSSAPPCVSVKSSPSPPPLNNGTPRNPSFKEDPAPPKASLKAESAKKTDAAEAVKPKSNEPAPIPSPSATSAKKREADTVVASKSKMKKPGARKIWTAIDTPRSSNLKPGEACYVNYIWNPAKFTLVAVIDWPKFEELRTEVNEYCETAEPLDRTPYRKDILFASYNGMFYRCVVTGVDDQGKKAKVTFVDDGDSVEVDFADCREPDDDIMKKHPIYGGILECGVGALVPEDLPLTEAEQNALQKEVLFETESVIELGWRGKLLVTMEGCGEVCWNDHLIEKLKNGNLPNGNAVGHEIKTENSPVETVQVHPKLSQDPPINAPEKEPVILSKSKWHLSNFPISPSLRNDVSVYVNYGWNCRTFTVAAAEDFDKMDELQAAINRHVATAPPLQKLPDVEDVVLCCYEDGELYYRAVVQEVKEDGTMTVGFIDYGDQKNAVLDEIREVNDEVSSHPVYGLTVILDAVPEDVKDGEIEELQEISQSQSPSQLHLVKEVQRGIWKGELIDAIDRTWSSIVLKALEEKNKN